MEHARGGDHREGWEIARARLPQRLRPFVASWTGYREWRHAPVRRVEPATTNSMLIFEFGPPLSVFDATGATATHHGGFFAGLDDRATLTQFTREQAGIQVALTPFGAAAFVAQPMQTLARQVVGLEAFGIRRSFTEQLAEAATWCERFDCVRALLDDRFSNAVGMSNVVRWTMERTDAASGHVRISELSEELGYSRKHLHERFTREVGLSPKRYAELKRFEQLSTRLRSGVGDLATLAVSLGYSDQSHLSREAKRFSGMTATAMQSPNDALAAAIRAL